MRTISKDEVRRALKDGGLERIDASMLSKCTGLVNSLNLKPEVVTVCWEAFSVNKKIKALTDHSWQSFSAVLRKEADKNPSSGNTPMNEEDDDDAEGAVVRRRGLGKRQAGSPADSNGLALVTPPTKRTATNSRSTLSAVDVIATTAQTPVSVKSNNSIPPPNLPRYEERTGAGKVILTYNPNNLEATASSEEKQHRKCDIFLDSFDTNVSEPYRHLFTTMEDRAKALDQQLVRMEQILMQRYNIGTDNDMPDSGNGEQNDNAIAPLEVVGVPRQEKICNIGRICNAAHEGRINQTSVVLEGSKHTGGARVEVDLSHLQADKSNSFSLFPGQIVAIEGVNSTGRKLVAHRICEGAAHGPIKSTAKQLLQYHHNESFQNGAPLKIMTVSGPYTTSDDLSYQPILDFFNQVMLEKPDVVIMVGPFVDMRHDHIQSGKFVVETEDGENLLLPPESFFCHHIAGILEQVFYDDEGEDTDMQTQFVLVPSLDDATAEWVYPQPPFQDTVLKKKGKAWKINGKPIHVGSLGLKNIELGKSTVRDRRVHCAPNPCTLKINEVVIGVTGTDAVFHMSADETNGNLVPGSRLERISQHMLQQRSYYPLFPPALGTNLDLSKMSKWSMPCQPDLLIVPSKLTNFARKVLGETTVVVNPGQLSKNTTGGTYAVMNIHPIKREELESAGGDDVEMDHNVANRLRLEIKKI